MENEHIRVTARTADLRASSDGDDPARFSGIAVAPGDILHMDDGTPVLFTEEELKAAAVSQEDEPLTVDHPRDGDGRPQYPPPTDDTVGKVTKAGFIEDRGVGYEAVTHDDDIASGIQAQSYEVSVHPEFALGEKDPETGAMIATDINFRDLSVVSKGDSPNNTANWGPNQALAAWSNEHDVGSELAASDTAKTSTPEEKGRNVARGFADELRDRLGLTATDNEPAEPGAEEDNTETDMGETEHETPEEEEEDDDPAPDQDSPDEDENVVEVNIGDHDSFEEYISAQVDAKLEEATAQKNKKEKVDELIANSDDFDEDQRDELMASSESLIESHLDSLSGSAEGLPGNVGAVRREATASLQNDDDDTSAYGAGVEN